MQKKSNKRTVMLNSFQHPHLNLLFQKAEETLKQVQGDNMRLGFTLIELLVVVLIIGILAAVALPQYQKAVDKSRLSEAKLMLRSIYNATQLCVLQYGAESEQCQAKLFDNIDIDLPSEILEGDDCQDNVCFKTKNWEYGIDIGCTPVCLYAYPRNGDYYLQQDDYDTDGEIICTGVGCVSLCGAQECSLK